MEQRQYRIGEGQFGVDAVLGELSNAGVDVERRCPGEFVVLHQDGAEVAHYKGVAFLTDHVCAVLEPDPWRLVLEIGGEAFVEDVGGQ